MKGEGFTGGVRAAFQWFNSGFRDRHGTKCIIRLEVRQSGTGKLSSDSVD